MAESTIDGASASVPRPNLVLALALLILTGLAYGLSVSLMGVGIFHAPEAHRIPYTIYVLWTGLGAGLAMLLVSIGMRRTMPVRPRHLLSYVTAGTSGYAIPYLAMGLASEKGVPAGIISMLVALSPALTYVAATFFRLEKRIWWVKIVGVVIGLAGIALLVLPEIIVGEQASLPSTDLIPWILLCLLAPIGYTAAGLFAALIRPPEMHSVQLSAGYFIFGTPLVILAAVLEGEWWFFPNGIGPAEWSLITIVFVQGLGIYLFIELIRLMGPVFFSAVNFIVPLAGIGWGILFFAEVHSKYVWGALILVLIGTMFVVQRRKERR